MRGDLPPLYHLLLCTLSCSLLPISSLNKSPNLALCGKSFNTSNQSFPLPVSGPRSYGQFLFRPQHGPLLFIYWFEEALPTLCVRSISTRIKWFRALNKTKTSHAHPKVMWQPCNNKYQHMLANEEGNSVGEDGSFESGEWTEEEKERGVY